MDTDNQDIPDWIPSILLDASFQEKPWNPPPGQGTGCSVWNFLGYKGAVGRKIGHCCFPGGKIQDGNVWIGRNVREKGNVWNPGNKSAPGAGNGGIRPQILRRRSSQMIQKEILESRDKKNLG